MAATFAFGMLWFNANVYVGPIREAIAGLKPNPRILMLSGEAALGHPLVRDVGGVWVSRQENLWLRAFTRVTREKTTVDAATDARLNGYLALERKWLIEDFRKLPPDIVLVDNLRDGWGDWARADAELSQLLKPYSLVRSVQGVESCAGRNDPRRRYFCMTPMRTYRAGATGLRGWRASPRKCVAEHLVVAVLVADEFAAVVVEQPFRDRRLAFAIAGSSREQDAVVFQHIADIGQRGLQIFVADMVQHAVHHDEVSAGEFVRSGGVE